MTITTFDKNCVCEYCEKTIFACMPVFSISGEIACSSTCATRAHNVRENSASDYFAQHPELNP